MKFYSLILIPVLALIMSSPSSGQNTDTIRLAVQDYNPTDSKNDTTWAKMEVKSDNLTDYSLVEDQNGKNVIKASSANAAGGLIYKIRIDPHEYPIIEWRWKVDGVLKKGNLQKKDSDDYPARIYVTFDYDKSNLGFGDRIKYSALKAFTSYNIPLRSINYIWANKAKRGTIAPNPFTDWVYMVAVQSGNEQSGSWMVETQNILQDYKAAFGEAPPAITGVAIMTDSDNTAGNATAYYGDIIFKKSDSATQSK
ncbi:DUF3047 domain-containing protein [Fodinibius salsisoli]|uniref:DUF3047 domain-containing protein n=1 Tax=Fodinibius salsisoli TaxID=2820877 RepID=A0ABT3PQB4_9BACT|nr:DUF3047 domain-containing protein [Fodinibius salsisoli]MCW9708054.1 DUF3047 domain-containing protein [Fodinibius salsisoli]